MANETAFAVQKLSTVGLSSAPRKRFRRDVYFIGTADGPVKIGMTCDVRRRLKELRTERAERLAVLALVKDGGSFAEMRYHSRFAPYRLSGEWYQRCPEIEAEIERLTTSRPFLPAHHNEGRVG